MPNTTPFPLAQTIAPTDARFASGGANPFEDLTDATALKAAAKIVETAAFNLATGLNSKNTAELIMMSQRLGEIAKRVSQPG